MTKKTNRGNYFEDFYIGQYIEHATPRTITSGDVALYMSLYGSRFPIESSHTFAKNVGYKNSPIDDLLTFHIVFGKTVPDISLNAIANLGYAEGRFHQPVYPNDTLFSSSEVIGLKENSNGESGIVYIRSSGKNQNNVLVLDFIRWVMVRKKDKVNATKTSEVPQFSEKADLSTIKLPIRVNFEKYNYSEAGSRYQWNDYIVGEKIDHLDGMTIEEAEHMMATRLYQNNAKVHFNQHIEQTNRFGRRLIYGGHIISLARALSFNGLANACRIIGINSGRHVAPVFAQDTIYAWSEVLEKFTFGNRTDIGGLRIRTIAAKDQSCATFQSTDEKGKYDTSIVLDFDYTVLIPGRCIH